MKNAKIANKLMEISCTKEDGTSVLTKKIHGSCLVTLSQDALIEIIKVK